MSLKFSLNKNRKRGQQQKVNHEEELQRVNRGVQPEDYNYMEIPQAIGHEIKPQGINHEVVPQNLGPTWWIPVHVRKELRNDLEEEKYVEDDRGPKRV